MKSDIYQKITNTIVEQLEKGVRPWLKPWRADHAIGRITRPLRANGVPYNGVNVLVLWSAAIDHGFKSNFWMSYKQAAALGAQVRKGEHGSQVVYADKIIRAQTDTATGEETERAIPFLKAFTVFNAEQIDGLPQHYHAAPASRTDAIERIVSAEVFFSNTKAEIHNGGAMAYYNISRDFVQMPPFESFIDAESYYATLAHETTHWTRHASRLNRDFERKRYGDEGYAMEELVAELGSAFICCDLDLMLTSREDHASYIASWIKVLKNDRRAIFAASSHAQRAADYLNGLQEDDAATAAA